MNLKKIISAILMALFMVAVSIVPAYATPPSTPHIESGSAADGGNYFEFDASYLGENVWRDLKTPPHWVVETGEIAYCLDHMAESPHGEDYSKFDPEAVYSSRTYQGLLAIIENSFPYRNAGLTDSQIRYSTANAIRAWIKESANIGYDFMLPSNNAVRPKTAQYQGAFNFYNQLLDKARNGSVINHTLTSSPDIVELTVQGNRLVGQTTINYSALNGKYEVNLTSFPTGTEIFGFTGNSGDVLTFELPLSNNGETIDITNAFTGFDNRSSVNVFWLDNSAGHQAIVVPIVDQMNPVTTVDITIKSSPSTVTITKHGKTNDTFIQGAVFGIYSAEDDTLIEELVTDESGKLVCSKVTFGDYYAKEIAAPTGYALDDTKQPFSITTDNMEVELDLYNYPITGQVGVVKGCGWKPLKDAVIGVYSIDGTLIEELITDTQGFATSGSLEYGGYYIKEITAPPGYVKSDEEIPFTIEINDRIIWLPLENELITGRVQINKVGENNEPLQGAVFRIYNVLGHSIDEIISDENGIAVSKTLDYGEYEIVEIKAPDGHNMNMISTFFNIENEDEIVEVTIRNSPVKGKVKISKTNGNDIPLQDAIFGVYTSDDSLICELTTDENGEAISPFLLCDSYYLKEITPPIGYNLNEDIIPFSISRQGQMVSLEVSNTIICGKVQILKIGEENNPLQGAIFGIYDINDVLIEELTTNENGIALSQDIIYGDYYIKELGAPHGYWINETPIQFSIDDSETKIVEFVNELIQKQIRVIKCDMRDNERRLAGAVFEVYKDSVLVDTITTNENGYAETKLLTVGEYTLSEVKAPVGFILEDIILHHTISNDEAMMYNIMVENSPTDVVLTKTDSITDTPLSGAYIQISNSQNEVVVEGATDENGELFIYELPIDTYTFIETIAPVEYTLSTEVFEFTFHEDGSIDGDTKISNMPTEVTLHKSDIITGLPVADAELEVFDAENISVYKGKTDESGMLVITHLPIGDYTFIETKSPDGYTISNEVKAFSIDEYGVVTGDTEITNCPTILQIFKVKYEDSTPLAGAGFKVKTWLGLKILSFTLNEDGTFQFDSEGIIDEIMVDATGEAIIHGLPHGSYWLEENTVPSGYYPAAPMKITITDQNDFELPCMAVIPNSVFVKLGLDRERYIIPIACLLLVSTSAGIFLYKRKRRKKTT